MDASNFNGDDIKKKLSEAGDKLKEEFGSFAEGVDFEELKKAGEKIADEAAVLVKKYPVQSAMAAFVAGTLVGGLLGRKR
jgi:ElaB/YqjD/DUF883 family membrane-anchored ribosome-binding protein